MGRQKVLLAEIFAPPQGVTVASNVATGHAACNYIIQVLGYRQPGYWPPKIDRFCKIGQKFVICCGGCHIPK